MNTNEAIHYQNTTANEFNVINSNLNDEKTWMG